MNRISWTLLALIPLACLSGFLSGARSRPPVTEHQVYVITIERGKPGAVLWDPLDKPRRERYVFQDEQLAEAAMSKVNAAALSCPRQR